MFLSVSLSVDVFHISLCVLTETLWFILVLRCNSLTGGDANRTLVYIFLELELYLIFISTRLPWK